jgi:predicted RNA-binding Zn ribbon-like protein
VSTETSADPALAFVGTLQMTRRGAVDLIDTPQALMRWLAEHPGRAPGLLTSRTLAAPEARTLHENARRLRAEIDALLEAHANGQEPPAWALHGLNRMLAATLWSSRLESAPDGPALTETASGEWPRVLLGATALAAARLLTSVPASRLRRCASPRCGAWFVDGSKGGRRRWCSMARCGNRAKAAAHRAKTRAR